MAESPDNPKEIVFFTEFDKDYKVVPANGIWVGNTTRTDIIIDFFIEQLARPETVSYALDEGGRFQNEVRRTPAKKFIRTFQMAVLLSPTAAEGLANAILERVNILKQSKEKP